MTVDERDVSSTDTPSFTDDAVRVLRLLWAVSHLEVLLLTRADPTTDTQHVHAALVDGEPSPVPDQSWSGSLCRQLAAGTGPEVAPDLAAVPGYARAANVVGTGLSCYVGALVLRSDDRLFGTVCGFGRAPRDASMHALLPSFRTAAALLGSTIAAAQLAEERLADSRRVHTQVLRDALTDPVTGLLNRTGLERETARERDRHVRYGHVATVVVCDVDGLKLVNDTAGHDAGDVLLRTVADRLRATVRAPDVVARSGGDEFVLLLPDERRDGAAVQRLRQALADLPVSVGAADTTGRERGGALAGARADADAAMYRAKQRRKHGRPRSADGPLVAPGSVVVDVDGALLGPVLQVFRELATGAASWATVRVGEERRVVAVPLAHARVVAGRLVLPLTRERALGAPALRSARVMTEAERRELGTWFARAADPVS